MHRTRGVLIRNFGRRQDPGVDDPRLEIDLPLLFQGFNFYQGDGSGYYFFTRIQNTDFQCV